MSGFNFRAVGRLHDVACHHRHGAGVDAGLVGCAVGGIPFFARQAVDAGHQVLVALIHAVAGEMLDRGRQAIFLHAFDELHPHTAHTVRVRAKGADVGDGVAEVEIDIDDGSEGPVGAHRRPFAPADHPQAVSHAVIVGRRHLHGRAQGGAFHRQPIAAFFKIRRQQQGDPGVILEKAVHCNRLAGGHVAEHQPAWLDLVGEVIEIILFRGTDDQAKQLGDFFLQRHACQGGFHPAYIFVGKIKGFGFQIDHIHSSEISFLTGCTGCRIPYILFILLFSSVGGMFPLI